MPVAASREAVKGVNRAAKELLAELSGTTVEGINVSNFGTVNKKTLSALEAAARGDLIRTVNSVGKVTSTAVKKAKLTVAADRKLKRAVAAGIKRGEPFQALSKRILNATGFTKGQSILLANGRRFDAEAYSRLVARTVPGDIGNEVHAAELVDRGVRYFKIPKFGGVLPTDYCSVAQGKVWAISTRNPLNFPVPPPRKKGRKRWPKYQCW